MALIAWHVIDITEKGRTFHLFCGESIWGALYGTK